MEVAMCNLGLPPYWIIVKTFHYKLLLKLALCINNLNFSLFNCLTIVVLDTLIILI